MYPKGLLPGTGRLGRRENGAGGEPGCKGAGRASQGKPFIFFGYASSPNKTYLKAKFFKQRQSTTQAQDG